MLLKWSDSSAGARIVLRPDLGMRDWASVSAQEKEIIWKHITNAQWFNQSEETHNAVRKFSYDYKARSFCNHLLNHGGPHSHEGTFFFLRTCCMDAARMDFEHIFMAEHQDVVYELISYYANALSDEKYKVFVIMFNDLAEQFGLNILLAGTGLIPRQEKKITEIIYEPTLRILVGTKWEAVNRELDDAFSDFLKNTPEGYSSSLTHTITSLQAFLQILVLGETGKGEIAALFKKAVAQGLIPSDAFSTTMLTNLISVLMRERQSKGDPHPKEEYANEKTARLALNLTMIFIQHCLQQTNPIIKSTK